MTLFHAWPCVCGGVGVQVNPQNPTVAYPFTTAMVKGRTDGFVLKVRCCARSAESHLFVLSSVLVSRTQMSCRMYPHTPHPAPALELALALALVLALYASHFAHKRYCEPH